MKIIKTVDVFFDWRSKVRSSVGFVPTMGALHGGHLALVKKSKSICAVSVVSVFVNPTQFSPDEDFQSYPKTLANDINQLEKLGVDVLFLPNEREMYDKVEDVKVPSSSLFEKLEGLSRPHFFYGVTQIVSKLFNVIKPSHAFFGEKDAQQLVIIKQMIDTMNYNIKLISCSTARDKNGLALSSRNQYLSYDERVLASRFNKCLLLLRDSLDKGETNSKVLKDEFKKTLATFSAFRLDYVSIASKKTLDEINPVCGKVLISAAVFFNDVRLIDNFTYHSST